MEIIRTHAYEASLRRLAKVGATDSDIESMEREIAVNPDVGDVIAGTGGLRKVRFGFGRSGKRGGGRTIYYALTAAGGRL